MNCDRGISLSGKENAALLVETIGGVRRLTLNRPDRLNALTAGLRQSLADALDDAARDGAIRAVVITGAGDRAFCAGQDLNESKELGADNREDWLQSWKGFFDVFAEFPKPLISAANGVAAGGGFEIALLSHVRIAVPEARFLMAEINIGLPCIVGSFLLESHLFFSRMVEMILSGDAIDARKARDIGLVHHLVPRARLEKATMAVAADLASKPPVAMQLNIRRFNELRREKMARLGVTDALMRLQREAVTSGEPQRVMAEFLAERARRRAAKERGKSQSTSRSAKRKGA